HPTWRRRRQPRAGPDQAALRPAAPRASTLMARVPPKRAPRKAAPTAPPAGTAMPVNGASGELVRTRQQVQWQLSALQTIQGVALSLSSETGLTPLLHKVVRGALDL